MPFDSKGQFAPIDPTELARIRALPRIVVRPKSALPDGIDDWIGPGKASDDGPDDWIAPGNARSDAYPDDWLVPPPTATPSPGQLPPVAEPNSANSGGAYPAVRQNPLAAYWSQIPASHSGALAWAPPYLPPSDLPSPFAADPTRIADTDFGPRQPPAVGRTTKRGQFWQCLSGSEAGSLCGLLVAAPGEPHRRLGMDSAVSAAFKPIVHQRYPWTDGPVPAADPTQLADADFGPRQHPAVVDSVVAQHRDPKRRPV